MDMPRLRIVNSSGLGHQTQIFIDDVDVSDCFNSLTVNTSVDSGVEVQLNAIICEFEVENALRLRMPVDGTRELLIKHGWTPPTEPVGIPVESRVIPYESVGHDLVEPGEQVSGEELIGRLFERIREHWAPNLDDTLTVERVYRETDGLPVPGRRVYTLRVTMNSVHPDPDDDEPPTSMVEAANKRMFHKWEMRRNEESEGLRDDC